MAFCVGSNMPRASGVWCEDSASPAPTSLSCASACLFYWPLGKLTPCMCALIFLSRFGNPFVGWRITRRGTSYFATHNIRIWWHMRTNFVIPVWVRAYIPHVVLLPLSMRGSCFHGLYACMFSMYG